MDFLKNNEAPGGGGLFNEGVKKVAKKFLFNIFRMARIQSSRDIAHLMRSRHATISGDIEVRAIRTAEKEMRCSFLIKKFPSFSAVNRNRWKRIMREIVRHNLYRIPSGYEFLVRLRTKPSIPLNYQEWERPVIDAIVVTAHKVPLI